MQEHFFAIGVEKKVQHPLVQRLLPAKGLNPAQPEGRVRSGQVRQGKYWAVTMRVSTRLISAHNTVNPIKIGAVLS